MSATQELADDDDDDDAEAAPTQRSRPTDPPLPPGLWGSAEPLVFDAANPKKGMSAERYDKYKAATTVREFASLGGSKGDLRNDLARGYARVLNPALNEAVEPAAPDAAVGKTLGRARTKPERLTDLVDAGKTYAARPSASRTRGDAEEAPGAEGGETFCAYCEDWELRAVADRDGATVEKYGRRFFEDPDHPGEVYVVRPGVQWSGVAPSVTVDVVGQDAEEGAITYLLNDELRKMIAATPQGLTIQQSASADPAPQPKLSAPPKTPAAAKTPSRKRPRPDDDAMAAENTRLRKELDSLRTATQSLGGTARVRRGRTGPGARGPLRPAAR